MTDSLPRGPISRIEWVEGELRRAILGGEFAPGERLLTVQLAERYAVSPTPLREVLHRFAGEGLVEFIPQKGARVSELNARDALELAQLRSLLDTANLKAAAEHLLPEHREQLTAASDRLVQTWQADAGHTQAAELAYRTFYEVVSQADPSTRLREHAALVRELGSRYRLAATALTASPLIEIHQRLRQAVLDNSPERISKAVTADTSAFAAAFSSA